MELLLQTLEHEWQSLVRLAPRILYALIAFLVLVWIGRIMARLVVTMLTRSNLPKTHRGFFQTVTRWVFVLLGVVVALNILGFKGIAASVMAGGGVTAIVVGFAFRGIGENFLAGLSLVMGRMFKVGDVIQSGEFEGQVRGIELRHTHIRAADGRDIFIPSIEIFSKPLVNLTKDGLRRLSFSVGIDYRDDAKKAREVLLQTVIGSGLVLEDPAPGVLIRELGANYVVLQVFFWVDTFKEREVLAVVPTQLMNRCRQAILDAGFTPSSEVSTNIVIGGGTVLDVRTAPGTSADAPSDA